MIAGFLKKFFLNDKIIYGFILINALAIYLQESDKSWAWMENVEFFCALFFLVEMICKIREYGFKEYMKSGWNRLDFTLVLLSIPFLIQFVYPIQLVNLSVLFVLRLMRIFRLLRTVHLFPGIAKIASGFKLAIKQSYALLLSYFVLIVIFGLISCGLFGEIAPEYFDTPANSVYSVFRMCTIEGWYEIPNRIAEVTTPFIGRLSTIYFCAILIMGGIIGMSFINSVFVDAMVSDNNDDLKEQLNRVEQQLAEMKKLLEEKNNDK